MNELTGIKKILYQGGRTNSGRLIKWYRIEADGIAKIKKSRRAFSNTELPSFRILTFK